MLPANLTTNEVKNAAGTETEFGRWRQNERQVEFALIGEAPNAENHLLVSHQMVSSGVKERRRSAVIGTLEETGNDGSVVQHKVSIVVDTPVGNIANFTKLTQLLAQVGSFTFLTGADSTFVYAGTGTGSSALINGTL